MSKSRAIINPPKFSRVFISETTNGGESDLPARAMKTQHHEIEVVFMKTGDALTNTRCSRCLRVAADFLSGGFPWGTQQASWW